MKSKKIGIFLMFLAIVFAIGFSEYVYQWGLVSTANIREKYTTIADLPPALQAASPHVAWNREDFSGGRPRPRVAPQN